MANAGAQLMNWFSVACELHRDWRNDIEGLGKLLSAHIPNYQNLMTSYFARKAPFTMRSPSRRAVEEAALAMALGE